MTMLLAYIIYSHWVSHVKLYLYTLVFLIILLCILFVLNLILFLTLPACFKFSSMADQN